MDAGAWAAVGVAIAWFVYRSAQVSEREGVLRGLRAELAMHGSWVGTSYSPKDRGSWPQPDYMVYKLATVAIDNAIAKGPGLFLNDDLTVALVRYRQVVSHLNQLIDKATDFQVSHDIFTPKASPSDIKAAVDMVEAIHIQGIGDMSLAHPAAAHAFYRLASAQLDRETASRVLPIVWAVTGANLSFVRPLREPLMRQLTLVSRFGVAALRLIRRRLAPK